MEKVLVLLRRYYLLSAISLNLFFLTKFYIQQTEYNDKVDQLIARFDRIDERLTNFMGYQEECKANQRDKDIRQDELLRSSRDDLNRFYVSYLPYIKFEDKKK